MENQEIPTERPENGESGGKPGLESVETQVTALAAERDRLAAEKSELQDRVLRCQADFENYRRRVERERTEISEYAAMEGARSLLPVLDDFERALKVETADKDYARGMDLIHQRMKDTLKKMGVEAMDAVGKAFDPHVHHAIEMTPTAEAPDHTVLAEYQRGYSFRGRLLRPAMVKVAVALQGDSIEAKPEQSS